jgi:hypothetical protein
MPGGSEKRRRKEFDLMHSRRARRATAGRAGLIVVGAAFPVLIVAYVVTATHAEQVAPTAHIADRGLSTRADGWGRGGYTMMPAPGKSSPSASSPADSGPFSNAPAGTSENWAGYASAGNQGAFTSVSASWTQPAVTCTATNTFASFWAGLDGDGTSSVEQTGTEADCDQGAATYQGWFEMFPNAPVFYNSPVQPGDAMSASVVANGSGSFTLTLTDSTENWSQVTQQTSSVAELGSAEVIAEAPSDGTVLPLSNFGTVNYTNVTADNAAIGSENPSAVTMVSEQGTTEATPSALTGDNAFSVTWDSDGAGATTTGAGGPEPSASATPTAPATGGTAPGRHHHW